MFKPSGVDSNPAGNDESNQQRGGKVVDISEGKKKGGKKSSDLPHQYRYAQFIATSPDLALSGRENAADTIDQTMYRWQHNHWYRQTSIETQAEALQYLALAFPSAATAEQAKSSVATAENLFVQRGKFLPRVRDEGIEADAYLPLPNVYLKLDRSGSATLVPPSRDLGLTYVVPGKIDLEANPIGSTYNPPEVPSGSLFGRYLDLFMPDTEVRTLLQEAVGSSLLNVNFERGFFLFGTGANGKSTLLHLLTTVHPYNCSLRPHLLGEKMALSNVPGKTLYLAPETPSYLGAIPEQILKEIISRDPQESESKWKNPIMFRPTGTLFAAMNNPYRFADHSHGLRRKVIQIPFSVRLTEDDPRMIKGFHRLIADNPAELQVFIDWAIAGALRLLKQGGFSPEPKVVTDFRREQELITDNVAAFLIDNEAQPSDSNYVIKNDFYNAYRQFCDTLGSSKPDGAPQFFSRVNEYFRRNHPDKEIDQRYLRGVEKGKTRSWVIGIKANDIPSVALS